MLIFEWRMAPFTATSATLSTSRFNHVNVKKRSRIICSSRDTFINYERKCSAVAFTTLCDTAMFLQKRTYDSSPRLALGSNNMISSKIHKKSRRLPWQFCMNRSSSENSSQLPPVLSEWRTVDWKNEVDGESATPRHEPSPVDRIKVRGKPIYVKRDDKLQLGNESVHISGNKARKMLALYLLNSKDFPSAVVSYGGIQSNAMLALATGVHLKNNQKNYDVEYNDEHTKKRFGENIRLHQTMIMLFNCMFSFKEIILPTITWHLL